MKKTLLFFRLLAKRQLNNVFFVLILVLIPVSSFVMSRFSGETDEKNNRVALYARDEDETAKNTIEELLLTDSIYEFSLCKDEDELIESVQKGDYQCGYIFDENISDRIINGKYKGNIIAVYRSGSILEKAVRETFFSVFFKQVARIIALDYIEDSNEFPEMSEEFLMYFDGTYDLYQNSDITFNINFETMQEQGSFETAKVIEAKPAAFPLRGIMAVLVMTGALLGLYGWLSDKEKGVFIPMRNDFVTISRALYVFVLVVMLGICAVVSIILCGAGQNAGKETGSMLLYVIVLVFICFVMSYIIRKSTTILSAMPVILIGSIIVCPVFVDISSFVPVFKVVRYFFIPYYYLILF